MIMPRNAKQIVFYSTEKAWYVSIHAGADCIYYYRLLLRNFRGVLPMSFLNFLVI
jgi:hypothetical protein